MTDQLSTFSSITLCDVCHQLGNLTKTGILMADEESIIEVNQHLADISGYRREVLQGMAASALIDPDDTSIHRFINTMQTDRLLSLRRHKTILLNKSRQKIPVMLNAAVLNSGERPVMLMTVADISKKLKREKELQNARQMESIAALSGGIAHDYNNLLTAIIGNLSLIQSHVDADDIVFGLINQAYEASMVAKSLTQKLITFSRGGSPIKETVRIAPLLEGATEFSLSGSNIKSEYHFQDKLFLVDVDKSQMGQAIHNLVMNAREAMPGGGTLVVSAENVSLNVAQSGLSQGQYLKIAIRDEGTGIPEENQAKIFNPYFSTKKRGTQKGMGLGLSICHSIIRRHNGGISIDSIPGRGTTVCIYLPSSNKSKIVEKSHSQGYATVTSTGNSRVLLMDDEEMIIKMARLILTRLGYKATFARHGREAIAKYIEAMENNEPFDAVILDLTIRGGMGGEETMQELTKIDPQVKAIVTSGYVDSPIMTEFEQYGFKSAVFKPYSLYEIRESLNCLLVGI